MCFSLLSKTFIHLYGSSDVTISEKDVTKKEIVSFLYFTITKERFSDLIHSVPIGVIKTELD